MTKEHDPNASQGTAPKESAPVASPQTTAKEESSLAVPIAIVFAGALVAAAIIYSDTTTPRVAPSLGAEQVAGAPTGPSDDDRAPAELLVIRPTDHVLGNPSAEVVIFEWSDTECPFCKRFHETMVQVMQQYGTNGNVAWVYRYFPLDQIHPKARKEGEALECAAELGGNAGFWKFADRIFEVTPANNGLDPERLPEIAKEIGLDVGAFTSCVSSGKYAKRIESDYQEGVLAGVRGTPYSIVVNTRTGKQFPINGALPYESVKTILGLASAAPANAPEAPAPTPAPAQ